MRLPGWLCFALSRWLVRRQRLGAAGCHPATLRQPDYEDHRASELRREFDRYFAHIDLTGLDVLDFGCGYGGLSAHIARLGARSATGIDLSAARIAAARARAAANGLPVRPRFLRAADERTINLPAASVDVILCFDVLEHVMEHEAIMREWVRVLRPGGRVLIHWTPWLNPYGPHINGLVPIPWAHVLFSERALLDTCARVYNLPEFTPKCWDLDEDGRKKPNKWQTLDRLPGVNRLTIAEFERCCREVGLKIERAEIHGFGGSRLARCTRVLTRLPRVREYFVSHAVYELGRPAWSEPQRKRSGRDRALIGV